MNEEFKVKKLNFIKGNIVYRKMKIIKIDK